MGASCASPPGRCKPSSRKYVATPEQLAIHELNVGAYCFKAEWLWDALHRIQKNPQKGEYYLTDVVELAVRDNLPVQAVLHDDLIETIGINTRVHLAEAEAALRQRINREHMLNGVSMTDPASTYIEVGRDDRQGYGDPAEHVSSRQTIIGEARRHRPERHHPRFDDRDRCKVLASVMEGAVLEDDVDIGPFARLRSGAHLAKHVHMGNFGEVKDSYLAPGVKMGHFSYIGNATIGANTNIGAGTITCNFDGEKKNPTEIGEDVFIGSDTMLVAPVKIGARCEDRRRRGGDKGCPARYAGRSACRPGRSGSSKETKKADHGRHSEAARFIGENVRCDD